MQWHIVVSALRALAPVIALALASALVALGVQPPAAEACVAALRHVLSGL